MIERLIEIIQNAKFAKWALHDKVLFLAKLLFEQNCIMQVCDKDERLIEMVHSARWAQWAHPYFLG